MEHIITSAKTLLKQNVQISKTLSWLLRHGLHETSLTISSDGYVKVSDVLSMSEFKGVTQEQIIEIVQTNDKQRFSLKTIESGEYLIRANQGHSKEVGELINQTELLKELEKPLLECIHGTSLNAWTSIEKQGLKTMARTHIHFAVGQNSQSGFKKDSAVLIYIDMAKAMADGIKFYMSDNKVILTEGLNGLLLPKYFSKVVLKNKNITDKMNKN
jgi:2'-phosphotransferase